MPFPLRLLIFLLTFCALIALTITVYKRSFPALWERAGKRVAQVVVGTFGLGVLLSVLAWLLGAPGMRFFGLVLTALGLVTAWLIVLTLPIWGGLRLVVWGLDRWQQKRGQPDGGPSNPSRRRALRDWVHGAASAVPTAATVAGPVGTAAALLSPVLREVEVEVAGLAPGLDGLTILQLTDVHLGTFIDVDQVQSVVDAVADRKPDLVVLTGDISDDYEKLPAALEAVASLKAPLGAYACIGNHEIYRGRTDAEKIYAASEVQMLCNEGRLLEHKGASLWVCGADDPARLGQDHRSFLEQTVSKALAGRPADAASIVLCHRPEGFEAAARKGATLTLAGHTHGAQVALFGRSLFEPILPRSYLLGLYEHQNSFLYTSAGLGHWMPFRLNCPCEAPIVTLRRAKT